MITTMITVEGQWGGSWLPLKYLKGSLKETVHLLVRIHLIIIDHKTIPDSHPLSDFHPELVLSPTLYWSSSYSGG
jgi:hypothetical protein